VAQFLFEHEKMAENEFEAMMKGEPMPGKAGLLNLGSHFNAPEKEAQNRRSAGKAASDQIWANKFIRQFCMGSRR
jgi:hypothetical protein